MHENIKRVREYLDKPELFCQLAEECAELGKAALKLRRAMANTNPTPYTESEAWGNLTEEVADVIGVLKVLEISADDAGVQEIQKHKFQRWVRRLEEGKCKVPQTSSKR